MFKNAQINDRVWDLRFGWGTIKSVYIKNNYPIKVDFDKGNYRRDYTFDGKSSINYSSPTLFWNEFEVPKEAFIKPLPKLEVDTKVLVWDNDFPTKKRRHFYEFNQNGLIRTYTNGATSFSTDNFIETWHNWELYNES